MYFIRCLWLETLQTPTVWLQPSLLPPFLKRTSPVSPVWTTTGLDLRCVYFLPPFAFQFSIQLLVRSLSCFISFLQVAMRCGVPASHVKNVIIWGNHSSTQYPDVHHCMVNMSGSELTCFDAIKDEAWLKGDFIAVSYTFPCCDLKFGVHLKLVLENLWLKIPN